MKANIGDPVGPDRQAIELILPITVVRLLLGVRRVDRVVDAACRSVQRFDADDDRAMELGHAVASGDINDHVSCIDEQVGAGEAYVFDPAMAIVVAQAIASDHPKLQPLVDAVADYQRQHPNTDLFTFEDEVLSGKTSANFVLLVATLAERPDLATEDVLNLLMQLTEGTGTTARSVEPGGIHGLTELTYGDRWEESFSEEMHALVDVVQVRMHAAEEEKGVTDVVEAQAISTRT